MEKDTMTGNAWVDIDLLCDELVKIAEAAATATEAISSAFSAFGSFMLDEHLIKYATDRQWHLLNHGSPKVRKKWENALLCRARIAEKRRRRKEQEDEQNQ